jgi:hypothetical protein
VCTCAGTCPNARCAGAFRKKQGGFGGWLRKNTSHLHSALSKCGRTLSSWMERAVVYDQVQETAGRASRAVQAPGRQSLKVAYQFSPFGSGDKKFNQDRLFCSRVCTWGLAATLSPNILAQRVVLPVVLIGRPMVQVPVGEDVRRLPAKAPDAGTCCRSR